MRIAILEDDPDQLALLRRWIGEDGHDVHAYQSGREAMKQAGRESFDLFMLDWQVPDVSGAEVLTWLRANVSKTVPVLFVTVRDSEQDIVYALEHGADDYMVKPVRRQELLARVHALLRRAYPSEEKKQLSFPPFDIDIQRCVRITDINGRDQALELEETVLGPCPAVMRQRRDGAGRKGDADEDGSSRKACFRVVHCRLPSHLRSKDMG